MKNPRSFFALLVFILCSFSALSCGPAKKESKTTLTVWHWMTDREPAFQELAKRYKAQTGVEVVFELFAPSDAYTQKVRAAAQSINLPDIFGILGEKRDFASFIQAGHILNLSAYMEENFAAWRKTFFEKALAVNEFPVGNTYGVEPGIYGVPIDIMTIQMVYNKDLFNELGLDPQKPPQTFAEFIDIGKKITKEAKIQGFVSGWAEVWMIDCFANNYAFNIMGKDKVLATIRGEVPYTDPDWIKVLMLFKEMQEAGILDSSVVTMVNKNAEQIFATDRAVFAFNGPWCVNVYKGMNPNLNYATMLPPKASDNFPMSIWGGAGSSFLVNGRSKQKEEAVKFLKWFTDKDQQAYLSETTQNIPANQECLGQISEILSGFAKNMEIATHPYIWGISEYPQVTEAMSKGIQSIIIAEKTPEQVAREVQKTKERLTAKRQQ